MSSKTSRCIAVAVTASYDSSMFSSATDRRRESKTAASTMVIAAPWRFGPFLTGACTATREREYRARAHNQLANLKSILFYDAVGRDRQRAGRRLVAGPAQRGIVDSGLPVVNSRG